MLDQTALQVSLGMPRRKVEELDEVAVLEDGGGVGMQLSQRCCDFHRGHDDPLEKRPVNLAFQFPARPLLGSRHAEVELALLGPLRLAQDEQIVGPR